MRELEYDEAFYSNFPNAHFKSKITANLKLTSFCKKTNSSESHVDFYNTNRLQKKSERSM